MPIRPIESKVVVLCGWKGKMQYLSNAYICELNKIDKHFGSTKVLDPEGDRKTIKQIALYFWIESWASIVMGCDL